MRHIPRRLWNVLTEFDTEPIEVFDGLFIFAWGCWLAAPWFDFAISNAYSWMATHGSRHAWGLLMATIGLHQLAAVGLARYPARKFAAVISMCLYEFLGVMLFFGDPRSAGLLLMTIFAMGQAWVVLRR